MHRPETDETQDGFLIAVTCVLALITVTGIMVYKGITGVECNLRPTKLRPFTILTLTEAANCREVELWDNGDVTGRGCLVKRIIDPEAQKCDPGFVTVRRVGTWYRYEILKANIGGTNVKTK